MKNTTRILAMLLALGRSAYAKYGKNIIKVLLFGMAGALVCYITAGVSNAISCKNSPASSS